jgi:hypothetical protein
MVSSKELIRRWRERLPSLGIVREQQLYKIRGHMRVSLQKLLCLNTVNKISNGASNRSVIS